MRHVGPDNPLHSFSALGAWSWIEGFELFAVRIFAVNAKGFAEIHGDGGGLEDGGAFIDDG